MKKFFPNTDIEDLAIEFLLEGRFGNIDPDLMDYINYDRLIDDLIGDYEEINDGVVLLDFEI